MSTDHWQPFRPSPRDLTRITDDVAEVAAIQRRLVANCPALVRSDRAAHQYQIAGSYVYFSVANELPKALDGVGLFCPGAKHHGIGRISTGLGTPHAETQPDFLGLMTAFQTNDGRRVDLLAINDGTAPTNTHRDFVAVLYATAESAGRRWITQQLAFAAALARRIGWRRAGATLLHIVGQTLRTFRSTTAYQRYWTGIVDANGTAGKFTFVPVREDNRLRGLHVGDLHLSEEWRNRQRGGDVEFRVYWIAYLDERRTPTGALTKKWLESHKRAVGTIVFPQTDPESGHARLWSALAAAMGANPGNWIAASGDTAAEPATEFGAARKIAYHISQTGRAALDPQLYAGVFSTGLIDDDLARVLLSR